MPKYVPRETDPADYLDADMTARDIIDTLKRLKFENGQAVVQLDRPARDSAVANTA